MLHGLEGLTFSMKPNNSMLAYTVLVCGGFKCEPEGRVCYPIFCLPLEKSLWGLPKLNEIL